MFVVTAAKVIFGAFRKLFKQGDTNLASVELWATATTALLVVRFLFDFSGPWYSSAGTLATVQIIDILNYNMVYYTLGLMQLSPPSGTRVNDYFQVWAVLMVSLQFSVKISRVYGRSKQLPLRDLMSSLLAGNLLRVQTVFLLKFPLWFIWSVNAVRIFAYFLFSDRWATSNLENTRLVCDYMMYEHKPSESESETPNTDTMIGYKYLVLGEDQQEMELDLVNFRVKLDMKHKKLITVEKVWGLLGKTADPDDQLKDVCLSFALYKLLRRRFYDLPIHEAEHEKTKKLIFEGILKDKDDDYERAFRVTGVELSFLQDLYHSKHAQMFAGGFPFRSLLLSLTLVSVTGYIAYPVHHIPQRINPLDHQRNKIAHGLLVTYFIIGLIIAKEMAEIIMYVFSNWTKVQMICMHIKYPEFGGRWLVVKAMRCMFKLIRKGKWNHKIRQYNILISSRPLKLSFGRMFPTSIKLEPNVKTAIFQSFKDLYQNPEPSKNYFSHAFGSKGDLIQELKKNIDLEADTHRILVWHIATCLCEIDLSDNAPGLKIFWLKSRPFVNRSRAPKGVWEHYMIASSLSNYCGYLLTKSLLPDTGLVVEMVFSEVLKETNRATSRPGFTSLFDIYDNLMRNAKKDKKPKKEKAEQVPVAMGDDHMVAQQVSEQEGEGGNIMADPLVNEKDPEDVIEGNDDNEDTIIKMGTRLGKHLMGRYQTDRVRLWTDLAKFWTGFLLHLAAGTGAAKHKAHLSGSGELITHLWALMSHAGILGNPHGHHLLDPVNLTQDNNANRDMADKPMQSIFN